MSRLRSGKARENAARFYILAERDVHGARIRSAAGLESKRAVFFDISVTHDLQWIRLLDFRRTFDQVHGAVGRNFDLTVAWQIDRIVLIYFVCHAVTGDRALTRKTD